MMHCSASRPLEQRRTSGGTDQGCELQEVVRWCSTNIRFCCLNWRRTRNQSFLNTNTSNRRVHLSLEVAVSEGHEIYAWPGATRFDTRDVDEIIRQGPIGTGAFGTHLIGVFDNPSVDFHYVGEKPDGNRTVWYADKTTVIPTGAQGNDGPITITRESWYSPELNMIIRTVSNDPRSGTQTTGIANLSRNDPDPSLFMVPLPGITRR